MPRIFDNIDQKSNLSFRIFTERGYITFHEPTGHLTLEKPP